MTRATPDPTRWLSDLLSTEHVLWPSLDIAETTKAMTAATEPWTKAVAEITKLQMDTFTKLASAWTAMVPGATTPEPISDRRFADDAWTKDPRYEALASTYLAQTDLVRKALDAAPLDERSKAQWGFALRSGGGRAQPGEHAGDQPRGDRSWRWRRAARAWSRACELFTEDLAQGRISMTDDKAFEVGVNVCTTPGSVVYQNELIQLIQYTPTTDKVYKRPLVIVPPCINKYYILDLQPANSFVAHAVAEGHTVFLVSWRNAGAGQGKLPGTTTWSRACCRAHRRRAGDHQGRQGQHPRVLRRRHAAGQRARRAGGA